MKLGVVYLMLIIPSLRIKVGYTAHLKNRRADISESLPFQFAITITTIKSRNYIDLEKQIHEKFDEYRYTYMGSGKTEYFERKVVFQILAYMLNQQPAKMIAYFITAITFIFFALFQMASK